MKRFVCAFLTAAATVPALDVTTWQPYYNQDAGYSALQSHKDVITRLGLQFWLVESDGSLTDNSSGYTTQFVNYAKANGIKILITPYNAGAAWEWDRVKGAIAPANKAKFIKNLLTTMRSVGADGIDLDLEGLVDAQNDELSRRDYTSFVLELADSVHKDGKILTIDTYAYHWNGPNDQWWGDWRYKMDAIHVMGYEETGHEVGTGTGAWRNYSNRQEWAKKYGMAPGRMAMGLPSYKTEWQGKTAAEHVAGCVTLKAPIAIWDLPAMGSWATTPIKNSLKQLKTLTNTMDFSTQAKDSARVKNFDWITKGNWSASSDDFGTIVPAQTTVDLVQSINGRQTIHFTAQVAPKKPDSSTWSSLGLYLNDSIHTFQADLSYYPGVMLSYRSNVPFDLRLEQVNPGAQPQDYQHKVTLPASTKFRNAWIPFSSFVQPATALRKWNINLRQAYTFGFAPLLADPNMGGNVTIDIRALRFAPDSADLAIDPTGLPADPSDTAKNAVFSSSSLVLEGWSLNARVIAYESKEAGRWEIVGLDGKIQYSGKIEQGLNQTSIMDLPKGIYHWVGRVSDGNIVRKMYVNE